MTQERHSQQAGFSFLELMIAMVIMVVGAAVLINHLAVNYLATRNERDRVFAYTKAQGILAEIQGLVDRGGDDATVDLDTLDDGTSTKPTLSIQTTDGTTLLPADHVVSGNYRRSDRWVWSRRISVQPFAGVENRNMRYVTVRVYRRSPNGSEQPMADLSAVVNSASGAFPTTQVYDLYLIAIENVPGWWVHMDSMKPFVESMVTDLETRNPGLKFRTHWITKASFGRNQGYRPYFNEAVDSLQPVGEVYHYPGLMPTGSASTFYYMPDNVSARIVVDGEERNGYDADFNPYPYALADYFNHAMRYPDELRLWQRRVAAIEEREEEIADAIRDGRAPPEPLADMSKEPTLRLFLDDMYANPDSYKNAMLINLHGELLPMPALRNYSDAARDPENYPNIRVVTHPAQQRTARNAGSPASSESLQFRIYAYNDHGPTYTGSNLAPIVMVDVVGINLLDPLNPNRLASWADLQCLRGGTPVGPLSDTSYYPFAAAKQYFDVGLVTNEMRYWATWVTPGAGETPYTRIYLWNTPVVAPPVGGRGLENTERAQLYWMPYVPSPVESARDFSRDLYWSGSGPKNTARWKLTIAPTALTGNVFVDANGSTFNPNSDVVVEVRTRIYSGASPNTTGTMWPPADRNQPDNLSVTYAWWADSAEDVPFSERYQFNGDPRHVPYKDLFNGDPDYPNGYNPYFDELDNGGENSAADYAGLEASRLANRWSGQMACDVPRYLEFLRQGLVRSQAVYTTLTGFSYYYLGIGNDIGYDAANGYPNSIPSDLTPHGAPGVSGYLDTITGARRLVRAAGSNYWWGKPWLGELYPDSAVGDFMGLDAEGLMRGNLVAGITAGQFHQLPANTVYAGNTARTAYGTALNNHIQRLQANGCTTFFNIGSTSSSFRHSSTTSTGALSSAGQEMAANYNMPMPTSATISRPFTLTGSGMNAEHWSFSPYSSQRFTASLFSTYYSATGGTGSGVVKLVQNGGGAASYVVVNGIDRAIENGTSLIAQFACLSLLHTFLDAGRNGNSYRIQQLPRVEIKSPTDITELVDPSQIEVQYGISWTRWDGLPYTATGSFGEDEDELQYVLSYSSDGGTTWYSMETNEPVTPSKRPDNASLLRADRRNGDESYVWGVPSGQFPDGGYLINVDCFRDGAQQHYAWHRTKIYIQR
ncbi:MAG: hypothetical protein RL398_3308 [Planctomycetota bacterium]